MNLLGLGGPSRATIVRRTRIIGVMKRIEGVPFSTKKIVSTNGNASQDGGHHNKCEEHRYAPHIDRGKMALLEGQVPRVMKGMRDQI